MIKWALFVTFVVFHGVSPFVVLAPRLQAGGGLAVAWAGHGFCVIVPGLVLRL